jgi:hypothetical protein
VFERYFSTVLALDAPRIHNFTFGDGYPRLPRLVRYRGRMRLKTQEASLPEPKDKDDFRSRLRGLPGQILMALINGTAILVIVAAILTLVALSKVTHLAHDVASTMTDAVLSRIDVKPQQVRTNLQNVAADVRELRNTLKQARTDTPAQLDPEIAKLNERLSALQSSINNFVRLGLPSLMGRSIELASP